MKLFVPALLALGALGECRYPRGGGHVPPDRRPGPHAPLWEHPSPLAPQCGRLGPRSAPCGRPCPPERAGWHGHLPQGRRPGAERISPTRQGRSPELGSEKPAGSVPRAAELP